MKFLLALSLLFVATQSYGIDGRALSNVDAATYDGSTPTRFNRGLSSGLYYGGVLSVTAGQTNQIDITDGAGVVVDNTVNPPLVTDVSWSGLTNQVVTGLTNQLISFVSISSSGTVSQSASRWTQSDRRNSIPLGVAVHVNKSTVDVVNNQQVSALDPAMQLYDLIDAFGFIRVSGLEFSANAGANLTTDMSSGVMFGRGINWANDVENPHHLTLPATVGTNTVFQYRWQDGDNYPLTTPYISDVSGDFWDNGGVSNAVAQNQFTVQRVFAFTSGNIKIQPGQAEYGNLNAAIDAINTEDFVVEPSIKANGLLVGFFVLKENVTDLTDSAQARFFPANKLGEGR